MDIIDISKGVDVGGFHYIVDVGETAQKELHAESCNGQCNTETSRITLNRYADAEHLSKTFIHELLEAVNHIYCHDNLEHNQITSLGYGIHQAMESLGVRFGGF